MNGLLLALFGPIGWQELIILFFLVMLVFGPLVLMLVGVVVYLALRKTQDSSKSASSRR